MQDQAMNEAQQKIFVAAVLVIFAAMLSVMVGRLFFGLSHEHMLVGGGAAFAALVGVCMLGNRLAHGVWIKRPTEQERVVLDAGLKRAQLGYFFGSLALLPVAFLMIKLGFDSHTAMIPALIAGAIVAAILFMRHRKQST
jgi:hypothetical protein